MKYQEITKYINTNWETFMNLNEDIHDFAYNNSEYGLTNYIKVLQDYNLDFSDKVLYNADYTKVDEKCILAMILAIFRAERTCEGIIYKYYKRNKFNEWLLRLKELDK